MDEFEHDPGKVDPAVRSAPPTAPGQLGAGPRSGWPTVFGILSIIYASLGLTCTCSGVASLIFVARAAQSGAGGPPGMAAAIGPMWWNVVNSLVTLILAGVAMAAGVLLLRRRRISLTMHVWWALAKIVWLLAAAAIGFVLVSLPMLRGQGGVATPGGPATPVAGLGIGVVLGFAGLLVWMAYPIVVLVWMRRAAIRHEAADWR